MIAIDKIIAAAQRDDQRFKPNPRGDGYLTRAERWTQVVRYARAKELQKMEAAE